MSTGAADEGIDPACAQHGVRDGMGDPVAADSRLRALRSRAGCRFPSGNGAAAAGRPASFDCDRARYENALVELLNQKRKGEPVRTAVKPRDTGNVVNLMDALRKSLNDVGKGGASQPAKTRKPKKAATGQREMLMAISGKSEGFGFGWLLHRQIDLIRILERRWLLNLVLAIGLIAASFVLASVPQPRPDAIRFAGATCYALAIWTTTFAVIGVALRFLSGFSATQRYIADASYWLYLIHMPIVMALQVAVSSLDWPWPAKFATILLVAVPVMLGSYQLLVRHTFIGAVLNGRRMPRTEKSTGAAASSAAT
jgi:acyltransferase-like protein